MTQIFRIPTTLPDENKHILVRSVAHLYSFKTKQQEIVLPVWREAYYYQGQWQFWCGKHGTTCTSPCVFTEWCYLPQAER